MFCIVLIALLSTWPLFGAQKAPQALKKSAHNTIHHAHLHSAQAFAADKFIKLQSRIPGWVVYRLDDEVTQPNTTDLTAKTLTPDSSKENT